MQLPSALLGPSSKNKKNLPQENSLYFEKWNFLALVLKNFLYFGKWNFSAKLEKIKKRKFLILGEYGTF